MAIFRSRLPFVGLLAFALVSGACVWGTVKDQTSGLPIDGATVVVTDSHGKGVTLGTNANGFYSTGEALATGPATFSISAPGYQPLTITHDIAYDDNEQGHEIGNFTLVPLPGTTATPPGVGGTETHVGIVPDPKSASGAGNTVDIQITGADPYLRLYSVVASYDGTLIDVTRVDNLQPALDMCPALLPDTGGGAEGSGNDFALEATCGTAAESGLPSGTVVVARVTFDCLRAGSTTLTFTTATANLGATLPSQVTPVNGTITCG